MVRFLHLIDSFTLRKCPKLYLACSWILGLGCGGLLFRYTGEYIVSVMPLAATCQLSIVSLFLSTLLPFLFSAYSVYLSIPWLLFPIGFLKALFYSYAVCGVLAGFGQHGWLVRLLLLFTDSCSVMLLYGYLSRHISGVRTYSHGDLLGCIGLIGLLVGLDYCYISPFLRLLLS